MQLTKARPMEDNTIQAPLSLNVIGAVGEEPAIQSGALLQAVETALTIGTRHISSCMR